MFGISYQISSQNHHDGDRGSKEQYSKHGYQCPLTQQGEVAGAIDLVVNMMKYDFILWFDNKKLPYQ